MPFLFGILSSIAFLVVLSEGGLAAKLGVRIRHLSESLSTNPIGKGSNGKGK